MSAYRLAVEGSIYNHRPMTRTYGVPVSVASNDDMENA